MVTGDNEITIQPGFKPDYVQGTNNPGNTGPGNREVKGYCLDPPSDTEQYLQLWQIDVLFTRNISWMLALRQSRCYRR
ncbi:hypothetical protein MmTuc01_3137 [Methanosarcina mazei Tuc01]|uniref:Uncharacterized protein n=1 Tax=Methanosarcina mazei Tuc01 TaxID=1236903 RepID=M1QMZ6_METMZ|nr:hypothetical protein [Methanosarcina mazei]AGF98394.1 hypothetical protein MmTuc01_3137 [Methanosarcina mazei Tuc01]